MPLSPSRQVPRALPLVFCPSRRVRALRMRLAVRRLLWSLSPRIVLPARKRFSSEDAPISGLPYTTSCDAIEASEPLRSSLISLKWNPKKLRVILRCFIFSECWLPLRAPLEDAVVVVVDEVEGRPGRLVAARQGDLPLVEGVEPLVVRGRVRHARGDHDAVVVIERYETTVEGAVVKRVEQEAVRRHEALARRCCCPRLDVARRGQGGGCQCP